MIRVARPVKPKILDRHAERWRSELLAAANDAERRRAEAKYRHREVKAALAQAFHGKCAYCESAIAHVDYGHIEHYRPKRGPCARPDLAFVWDNLLLACGICNGPEFKGDRFPEAEDGGPLLNPCVDDPDQHLEFRYDPVAKLASVYGRSQRGETTERVLGLNRRALRAYRSRQIRRLLAVAVYAESDRDAANLLEEARQADAEYAAFARALFPRCASLA